MSYLHGSALVPGAYHYGGGGLGIAGALVPSDGEHGAGYLYNDLALPADAAKEVRGLIETSPVGLSSFAAAEDSSLTASGPDGVYTFTYRLYVDGVDSGTATGTLTLGTPSSGTLSGSITLGDVSASGTLQSMASTISGAISLADVVASGGFAGQNVLRANPRFLARPAKPRNFMADKR